MTSRRRTGSIVSPSRVDLSRVIDILAEQSIDGPTRPIEVAPGQE